MFEKDQVWTKDNTVWRITRVDGVYVSLEDVATKKTKTVEKVVLKLSYKNQGSQPASAPNQPQVQFARPSIFRHIRTQLRSRPSGRAWSDIKFFKSHTFKGISLLSIVVGSIFVVGFYFLLK